MGRFFDLTSKTLHVTRSYAGAVKVPADVVAESVRIRDQIHGAYKLRRVDAGLFGNQLFFSLEHHTVHMGNYARDHVTNQDLVDVQRVIEYR